MVPDWELERVISGRFQTETPEAVRDMARELLHTRALIRELLAAGYTPDKGYTPSVSHDRKAAPDQ